MTIQDSINFADMHNGAIMAIITLVYTIITFILVIQNRRAMTQTKNQFNLMNDGKIFPSIIKIEGELLCLQFKNQSPSPVQGFTISINKEWLCQYDNIKDVKLHEYRDYLKALNEEKPFTLMPQQKMAYLICVVPGPAYKILSNVNLIVTITYNSGKKSKKEEHIFNLSAMGSQLTTIDDYVRIEKKKINELKNIGIYLRNIDENAEQQIVSINSILESIEKFRAKT